MPTPTLAEFSPISKQYEVIRDVRTAYNYDDGVHHILLSGAVGSAKSVVGAHLAVTHCLLFPNARFGIGRLSMPALKGTLFRSIIEHIGDDIDIRVNEQSAIIKFPNGSEIRSFSWSDKKYKKVRSYEFTAFAIEELTENDSAEIYEEISSRVGRLTHVDEKFIINMTNPDDPSHWAYDRFINTPRPNHHVYYSRTTDNPFLPESYVRDLKANFDPKMARRMLDGEWLSISQDVIYYAYDKDIHFVDGEYRYNSSYPVWLSFDFNIGDGKPLSACLAQFINGVAHFFDEVVIDGARTVEACEELYSLGYFNSPAKWIITGDASGNHRDTRGIRSDFDIIKKYFDNVTTPYGKIEYVTKVPLSNPGVRFRHNKVNSYLKNELGQVRIKVYKKCKTVDEGLRLTKLKKGGNYIEDDSNRYQHITTALGYFICKADAELNKSHGGVYARHY